MFHETNTDRRNKILSVGLFIYVVLDTIRPAIKTEKRESLRSCSSTATKAFNILPTHILS